ncbi:MAG TPA: hypothetical protein VNN80_06895 [Polyangiaceae bacterium]|nr:hypothetical protein [Polyangiaceae bacterium]
MKTNDASHAVASAYGRQPTNQLGATANPRWRRVGPRAVISALAGQVAAVAPACSSETRPAPPPPAQQTPAAEQRPSRVRVPGGAFSSGTEPGRFERRPELEPRLTRTALGPFEIDVEPYPGGGQPALLGLGRAESAERCAEQGGRLCTELEWERACKGPASTPFPGGEAQAAECTTAAGCSSGFGVSGMGRRLEWTASEPPGAAAHTALVRGASDGADPSARRCAHRELRGETEPGVAFRCCYGPPNAARVVLPKLGTAFATVTLATAEIGEWLARDPATARLARELSGFPEPESGRAVLAKGGAERPGSSLTTAPLRWNPAAGVDLIVVTARSGPATSFVAVFDALPDGTRQVLASFVLEGEAGPIALGYSAGARDRVRFGTCWNCTGEMGRVLYREPDRVLIVQP